MTPEQITAMVNALGYPVCVSIAMFAVNYLLLRRYFAATDSLVESTKAHAAKLAGISEASNASLERNSIAMKENTQAMRDMTGKLCRFQP